MYGLKITVNGSVRVYLCKTIADAEAMQDICAKLGLPCEVININEQI